MKTSLSIIIPVFNEFETVGEVLKRIYRLKLENIKKEVIVIDDCSTDGTYPLLRGLKKRFGFCLIKHRVNSGKGAAVKSGLQRSTGKIVMIQDADLEYQIEEYPEVLSPILKNGAYFVLGSRHLKTGSWKTREFLDSRVYAGVLNFGSILYSKLVNILYGVNLTDPGTMYKVFRRECLVGLDLKSNHFDIDWELVGKVIKKGYIPVEVPISYKSRSPNEGKKIKFLRDGFLILWAIVRYRFSD